jgi:hypothetical protein
MGRSEDRPLQEMNGHRPRIADDAMMRRARKPTTVSQLKQSMDRQFDRAERSNHRRFDRLDRRKADKSDLVRQRKDMRAEIATLATDLRAEIAALRTELRDEISRSAAETRRHLEVIADSLPDDLRIFADAIGLHSERLNQHETRIDRFERPSLQEHARDVRREMSLCKDDCVTTM